MAWFWISVAITIAWTLLWLTGGPHTFLWLLAIAWMVTVNIWILRPRKYPPRPPEPPR